MAYSAIYHALLIHYGPFWAHYWHWYYTYIQTHGGKGQPRIRFDCWQKFLNTILQKFILKLGF